MEREVGEGIGMGNTCKPMAVSFQCMTKSTTKKRKKEKKENQKKKKKDFIGFPVVINTQAFLILKKKIIKS